ncbi:hybrid non-ribosomal peptide synthetase/type I polyketide synthase [Veronia pacifica]|uniref:Carrier domain-containing protein n=1 Tax=Veronia pacifica TaxID=1080227 RepID=A0A1C3EMC5_9GAMM|nr:hybrid non-ribosomal peptide synthetase/type I polyketide synthase [Veronia pacifica]ODA34384.1 hypothetical protein A8L45_06575 [Veronia pacifica]
MTSVTEHPDAIAIIGMAGRFPQANDIDEFWRNLVDGVESINTFSADELRESGFDESDIQRENFIGAAAILDDIDMFDADFFQCTAYEATMLDPQQRFFLQCCWHALEHGGYRPDVAGDVGVFAGAGISTYLLAAAPKTTGGGLTKLLQLLMGNDKDYLASRVSYKLDLTGPSICVQSACSTSLLAVHTAAQSLLNGECRMALAGGVDISVPQKMGYEYQEGMIFSPDGHCRAFDADAKGTVAGNGAGVVLLKRLDDALKDGDNIMAVIRGSAVNNDGANKIGYTAPSIQGQAKVVADALALADVSVESIDYIEAHGTGTALGDPIEVRALTQVFRSETQANQFCGLGSVKTNIGHLNAAAGIASLIKTVMALKHGKIPPSLHYQQPNPEIDFANSPFYVNNCLQNWPERAHPRRAGVSSFGFGGTNVHMVLEQAPVKSENSNTLQGPVLIPLSATSEPQLKELAQKYIHCLEQTEPPELASISFTAMEGRKHFTHRLALLSDSTSTLTKQLNDFVANKSVSQGWQGSESDSKMIAALFTGQGAQYPDMAKDLYQQQRHFRDALNKCAKGLEQWLDAPLLDVLFGRKEDQALLAQTAYAQPALFAVEYALYEMWTSAGVEFSHVAGHSVGEIVAACVAGVLSLDDALTLIAARGRLIQSLPAEAGGMVAVFSDRKTIETLLLNYPSLTIAAENGPRHQVISGEKDKLDNVVREISACDIESRALNVSHAFHSSMLDSILDEFENVVASLTLNPPKIPVVSNVYGRTLTDDEITQPAYWRAHVREPVLFQDGVRELERLGVDVYVECGPHPVLSRMGPSCLIDSNQDVPNEKWLHSLHHQQHDKAQMLKCAAALYSAGVDIRWAELEDHQHCQRVPLPGYPFARERYWLSDVDRGLQSRSADVEIPVWQSLITAGSQAAERGIESLGLSALMQQERSLIQLAQVFIVRAFREMSLFTATERFYPLETLISEGKVLPQYTQLFERFIQALVEDGLLRKQGDTYGQLSNVGDDVLPQYIEACSDAFAQNTVFETVFLQSGKQLADVLTGRMTALEAMMGNTSVDEVRDIYADLPTSRYFNNVLRETVAEWARAVPKGTPLRILEIGAGTGATSEQLLPVLPADRCQYVYTDVSPLFLQVAAQRFEQHTFVEYTLFDINKDPCSQGFDAHSFDLIVASNVLHAGDDLRKTMGYVSQLLKPGAHLLMYEIVNETLIGELTTGLLLPLVQDTDLRGIQPFMTQPQWQSLLMELGFSDFAELPGEQSEASVLGERILLAQQAQNVTRLQPASPFYQLDWQYSGISADSSASQLSEPSQWLVFADCTGQADAVTELLKGNQQTVHQILPSASSQNMRQLLETVFNKDTTEPVHLLYFWGLNSHLDLDVETEDLNRQQTDLFSDLLDLLAELSQVDKSNLRSLNIFTRGTQIPSKATDSAQIEIAQSTLWGFSQVVALGHPELKVKLIDLDHSVSDEANATQLLGQLFASESTGEYQLVLRDNDCYWPRLQSVSAPSAQSTSLPIDEDGWYLIAGGLGGLGLETADWLAGLGAKNILLIGRNKASQLAEDAVKRLRERGVNVEIGLVDITDPDALQRMVSELNQPIKGVVHSAVVRDSEQLSGMTPLERAQAVLAPKLQGAWNLHRITLDQPLDFFILYSSSVSLVPARGLPEYVAGNAFLDSLAHYRIASGLPALSVSWGAWSDVGTVADPQQLKRLEQGGLRSFSPSQALEHLNTLLNSDKPSAHFGVMDVEWPVLVQHYPEHQLNGYFSRLPGMGENKVLAQHNTLPNEADAQHDLRQVLLDETQAETRRNVLTEYLQKRVGVLLRCPADEVPVSTDLMQLGVDSLMFLDLMNGLNQTLKIQVRPNELMADLRIESICRVILDAIWNVSGTDKNDLPLKADKSQAFAPFPLTDVQQAYWIGRDQNMDLGNVACHGYLEIDCQHLDIPALQHAWNRMVSRHAMLRCIIMPDGQQRVLSEVPDYVIACDNLIYVSPKSREEKLLLFRQQLSHRVPCTSEWPLFEIRTTKIDRDTTRLHISLDNIMTDGRSIGTMLNEWIQMYRLPDQTLPELDLAFRDYVVSLEAYRETEDYQRAKTYWTERLDKVYPAPQLPLAKEAAQVSSPEFHRRSFHLSSEQWQVLKKRGAELAGLTPSGLLLSVYAQVLAYWSESPKFTLNVPTFNRMPVHPQVNDIVGEFTSLILLSLDFSDVASFRSRATSLQKQLLQDQAYDSFSGIQVLRELVRHTGSPEQANMPVVFTSTFGLAEQIDADFSDKERETQQLLGEQVYTISQTPQVYIDNHVHDHGGQLNVYWDCVDEMFPADVLDDMFAAYTELLTALANDEDIWESTHPVTLNKEQQAKRDAYNATDNPEYLPDNADLLKGFLSQVAECPDKPALITTEQQLSYHQLFDYARWVAWRLQKSGVKPGDRVALLLPKGWQQVAAVLGTLGCGATYVPLDDGLPEQRLVTLLESAVPQHIIVLSDSTLPIKLFSNIPVLPLPQWHDAEQYLNDAVDFEFISSPPQQLAYIIYTSGSTGVPKGVMVDHRGALNTVLDINTRFNVTHQDVVFGLSALNFDLSVYDIFGTLSAGASLLLPDSEGTKDAAHWVELVEKHQVTVWNSVPALCQMLLSQAASLEDSVLNSLRVVMLSGDWIPLSLPQEVSDLANRAELFSLGGATEASIWSIFYPVHKVDSRWRSIPYGMPLANQGFHVLNSQLAPCPDWVIGELYITGAGLAKGYWQDQGKTTSAFIRHPVTGEMLYRTGDTGRFHPEGHIEFLGRNDDQVKVNGYRIELGDVEASLLALPMVKETLVIAVADLSDVSGNTRPAKGAARRKQRLLAYCVINQSATTDDESAITAMKGELSRSLPDYMIPSHFILLNSMPLTANGKVNRRALPAPDLSKATNIQPSEARTATEKSLLQACQQILGRQVGLDDHFFDIGGDSLSATRLSVALKDEGLALSVRQVFMTPSLRDMASACTGSGDTKDLVTLNKYAAGQPNLFCLHGSDGDVFVFKQLADQLADHINIIGIQAPEASQAPTLEDIAAQYIQMIKQQQSSGPYYLCGFSSGGVLAWEMAKQLQRAGDTVDKVILIDSGFLPRQLVEKPLVTLTMFAASLGLPIDPLPVDELALKNLACIEHQPTSLDDFTDIDSEAVQHYLEVLSENTPLVSGVQLGADELSQRFSVFQHYVELTSQYEVKPINGVPVLLLQTLATQDTPRLDKRWQRLADEFQAMNIEGNHLTCMQAAHVANIANYIDQHVQPALDGDAVTANGDEETGNMPETLC